MVEEPLHVKQITLNHENRVKHFGQHCNLISLISKYLQSFGDQELRADIKSLGRFRIKK